MVYQECPKFVLVELQYICSFSHMVSHTDQAVCNITDLNVWISILVSMCDALGKPTEQNNSEKTDKIKSGFA